MVLSDTDDEVESALSFEDFAHHASFPARLDDVLHALDVDAVPRRRGSIHDDLELRLPRGVVIVQILDTADAPENTGDVLRDPVHHEKIWAVELDRQLAFRPRQRFV